MSHIRSRTVFSAREDSIEQSGIALIADPSSSAKYTNQKQRRPSSPFLQRSVLLLIVTLSCAGIYSFVGYYDSQRQLSAAATNTPIYTFPETNTMPDADGNPHFIFHIGPPKTGTTTLQYALSDYLPVLKRDNYQYLGQVMMSPDNMWNHTHGGVLHILKDRQCMRHVNHARIHHSDEERAPYPDCWRLLRSLLGEYRRAGQSLILSEENFSIKYTELDGGLERSAIDWIALAELLQQQGWHPIVVIGYRRLFEIMPSAKQQWDRWNQRNHRLNAWPPEGRILEPLFPDVLSDPRLYDGYTSDWKRENEAIQWSYTDHLLQQISPYMEVRMMNIHQPVSLRTNLLCHVIPGAPHSCAQSKLDDATDGETVKNVEESLFYDALACAAAERGWIDMDTYTRRDVGVAIRAVQEDGYALDCPDESQTTLLLQRSLIKEHQLWPLDWVDLWREEHIAKFEKSTSKFCWIDVEATLAEEKWRNFFDHLEDYIDA